jgi:microcystin degradation protein MlrC
MRVFIASLATETNSFSSLPTGWSAYREQGILRDASRGGSSYSSPILGTWRRLGEAEGDTIVESISAFAQPAGRTVRAVYESLRDTILADLEAAGPVDLVLLALHGAMMAAGYDDCEGDLLTRVRAAHPDVVIGAELDLHCHLTDAMVGAADLLIPFKLYPHTDLTERAAELFALARQTATDAIQPVAALADTRMLGTYPTGKSPMAGIVANLSAIEDRPGVLTAGIAHGFPLGDVADVGTRVLVYADGDPLLAASAADEIAEQLYHARDALRIGLPNVEESLDRAAALGGRIVLGDYADNPGGGAPGDSNFMLRAILARGIRNAAIGCYHDPAVVMIAADAGVGARLRVRLGGKAGPESDFPLDLDVEVMALATGHSQDVFGERGAVGDAAWLRHETIDIVVSSIRTQVYGTDLFTGLGVDLAARSLIVVKSGVHYRAAFAPIADHLWSVDSPGAVIADCARIPYRASTLPLYPHDPDPWTKLGRPVSRAFPGRARR